MIKRCWISVLLIIGASVVVMGGMLTATQAEAQQSCVSWEQCKYIEPKGFYTCHREAGEVAGVCVCRWGNLETNWFSLIPGSNKSVCDFIKASGGGVDSVWALLGAATTVVTALTVMAGLISIVVGGYFYMTAGGNADRIRIAKIWIGSAILGIILALLSWLILASIADNLVGL